MGQMLSPADFGIPAGVVLADTSSARLDDGRIRLYSFGQGLGVVSAVSASPDGLSFIPEPGSRLPDGSGMPRVVRLDDGRWRLFFTTGGGIGSAISADGLSFTVEAGMRMTATQAGIGTGLSAATSGASVVRLTDGRYRMYFSTLPRPGDPPGGHYVKSAVSTDMLTWTMDPGVRLGAGATTITESSEHPFALSNPDGSVTVYYGKFGGPGSATQEGLYHATSTDGLTFTGDTYDIFFGNDPDVVRLIDGTVRMYYGLFSSTIGGTINAATCPDPTPVAAPAPATDGGAAGGGSYYDYRLRLPGR